MEEKIFSTGFTPAKKIFIALGENKKVKILPNKHYQFELSDSISRMVEYSYNRSAFFAWLSEVIHFVNSEENVSFSYPAEDIGRFCTKLDTMIEEIKDLVIEAETTEKNFNNIEGFEPLEQIFFTFTKVSDELRKPLEKQASVIENQAKYSFQCFYLKAMQKKLLDKKEFIRNDFQRQINEIIEEFQALKLRIVEIKSLEKKMMDATIFHFFPNEMAPGYQLQKDFKELQNCFDQITILKSRKISLELILNKEITYKEIIQELMTKHSQLVIEELIEPLYLVDLENLNRLKDSLQNEIQLYSPQWLMKQYEKNLNILLSDLNLIVAYFQKVSVKGLSIQYPNLPKLRELTIDNYKKSYMKDDIQKMIFAYLKHSRSNLEILYQSINSMRSFHLSVNLANVTFFPIVFSIDADIDEKYKILLDKIEYLNDSILDVYKTFRNMEIRALDGISHKPVYKTAPWIRGFEVRPFWLVELSDAQYAIVDTALIQPDCRFYCFTNHLFFLHHEKFNDTRKSLETVLFQISSIENRNNIKENIKKDIEKLSSLLLAESNEIQMIVFENIKNETKSRFEHQLQFTYVSYNQLSIDKNVLIFILGSIIKRLSLTKDKFLKKSKKFHEKHSITLKELFQVFFEIIFNTNIEKTPSVKVIKEWISTMVPANLDKLAKVLVSEKLFGSYLDDMQQPQKIIERKVSENCYSNLQQICNDIGNILFNCTKRQGNPLLFREFMEDYKKILLAKVRDFEPKLLEFLSKL